MDRNKASKKIEVNGIVQGVGFRPFVFQLAEKYRLTGEVANTSAGVVIMIEGGIDNMANFSRDLREQKPPLAHIIEIREDSQPIQGFKGFTIVRSDPSQVMSTLISPDVSICDDCRREMFDPDDRRHLYPFINCTNCGPRYTIIDDIPYDRPKTSMKHFKMCADCQAEYDDPADRRFHAQPNACSVCGPNVTLFSSDRMAVEGDDPIGMAADLLSKGRILAIKGLGGFHLAVDALNEKAVAELRQRKLREEKPLAVMSLNIGAIRQFAEVGENDEMLLRSRQRPIVLLPKKTKDGEEILARQVSPRNRYYGVMLPYTPLHYLLLSMGFTALVMTSGNLSEEPIAIDNGEAFERLSEIADFFLIHNRDIYLRSDDSIVRRSAGHTRFIRRSRGYVPVPVFLKDEIPPVLALGAELKNTICLTKGNQAFMSQHIGDLENLSTLHFFEKTIAHMKRVLNVEPRILAHDLHPDYLSTRYAGKQALECVQVQHHHAHIAGCMAENKVDGPVIGLSFDGTGYGSDGKIWGGEILITDYGQFERAAHFSYLPMPGGEAAIRQPWRMAFSYLMDAFGEEFRTFALPFLNPLEGGAMDVITRMIQKKFNSPDTSSLGRLFDGVAALVGIRNEVAFEGQAAMELEMLVAGQSDQVYEYEWMTGRPHLIPTRPIIQGIVRDIKNKVAVSVISSRFHATLVRLFTDLCVVIREERQLDRVVLSGGVFQNAILLSGLIHRLENQHFRVYTHQQVPPNDGGISLGQAVVAAANLKDRAN